MNKKEFKIFDILLSISITLLSFSIAINKVFNLNLKLAIFNFIVSIIPFVYILLKQKKITLYKNNYNFLLFLIFFIRIVTSVLSYEQLSIAEILEQICNDLSLFIISISIFSISETKSDFKNKLTYFPRFLILTALIFSVYNIGANFNNFSYFRDIRYRYLISFSSFFNNKNLFGIFLLVAIIACDYSLEESMSKKKKLIINCIKYFFVFNILLTISRNAILAFGVYFLIKELLEKKYRNVIFLALIGILIILLNPFNIQNFLFNFLIRSDSLTSGRDNIWRICFSYFAKSPILGYGEIYISNLINGITGVVSMHNWFIKLLLNGGFVNLICYVLIIINQFLIAIKNYKVKKQYSTIVLASLFSFVCYGLFEEINLFEFGLINIIITFYFIFMPKLLQGKASD